MKLDKKLKPISRTTLADEIFSQFLELIINRELSPGERLPSERELADKLGVGRSSVREALRALSAMGLLDARPGEGTFVTESPALFFLSPFILREHINSENASEVMEARLVLEVRLVVWATERGNVEEKDLIRQCFDNMLNTKSDFERSSTKDQDFREAIVQEDWEFHEAIAQAAGNSYLFQMFLMIRYLIRDWMFRPSHDYLYDYFSVALQEHQEILNAIQAGEAAAAGTAMQEHLEKAVERLSKTFQSSSDN